MILPPPISTLFPYTTLFRSLRREPYTLLDIVRVYTKAPGKKPDLTAPFTMPRGSTVVEVAATVHKDFARSEEHTSELQSRQYLVCRLLLEKKKKKTTERSVI